VSYPYRSALVTGASSGLGAEFARQLARQGVSLTVVARREARLKELAAQLTAEHGVQVDVLAVDLSVPAELKHTADRLRSTTDPVDLLVNCAGFGSAEAFAQLPLERQAREIAVNVSAPVTLAHAALEQMLGRRHGGILNVSSIVSALPMPKSAVYGAAKAFLTAFGESLYMETRAAGIHVTTVQAGLVRTEFHDAAGLDVSGLPRLAWLQPAQVVAPALRAVGKGRPAVTPGALNRPQPPVLRALPRPLLRAMVRQMYQV